MIRATPKRKPYLRTVKRIEVRGYNRKTRTNPRSTRFTIYGNKEDLTKARNTIEKENRVPKRQFEDRLNAEKFLKNPDAYSDVGQWTDEKIKKS